jgi:hypothetical protein
MTSAPSPHNLEPPRIHHLFRVDFESAWDALAGRSREDLPGRGNFMFARSAMGLLEFASRLCSSDLAGTALADFSASLESAEPRYFTPLPGPCARPGGSEWTLPHANAGNPESQLLWALFELVRHGQAHQGQQIMVALQDGATFGVSLTGVLNRTLADVSAAPRPRDHLTMALGADGRSTWILVHPEMLFLDVDDAIAGANLLNRGLSFPYLGARQARPGRFDFDHQQLRSSLSAGGHTWFGPAPP